MRFSFFTLTALMASFTYAQTIQDELAKIPACGVTCLTAAAQSSGCGVTDYTCQCGSGRDAITKAAIPCVTTSCQAGDLITITTVSNEICRINSLATVSSSISSVVGKIASSTSAATSTSASPKPTGNAGSAVSFGAAGAAVGMGAFIAAFAL